MPDPRVRTGFGSTGPDSARVGKTLQGSSTWHGSFFSQSFFVFPESATSVKIKIKKLIPKHEKNPGEDEIILKKVMRYALRTYSR